MKNFLFLIIIVFFFASCDMPFLSDNKYEKQDVNTDTSKDIFDEENIIVVRDNIYGHCTYLSDENICKQFIGDGFDHISESVCENEDGDYENITCPEAPYGKCVINPGDFGELEEYYYNLDNCTLRKNTCESYFSSEWIGSDCT